MKSFSLFLVAGLACVATARHVREAPAQQSSTDTLKDFLSQVQTNANDLAKQLTEQIEQVKEQNPAIQETWSSIVNRVKDTFKDANDLIPGAKEQAEALQSKFTDLSNLVKQEYDKISKNVAEQTGTIQENFAKNVKPTIDNLVQQIQTTGTKIQEAVVKANDPPAS